MVIDRTQYVGIEGSAYKTKMLSMAKKIGKKTTVSLPCLTVDCTRHFEVLQLFDDRVTGLSKMKNTEYYRFHKSNGKKDKVIARKIKKFWGLYSSIKQNGYDYKQGYIVLTTDGVRLDGSHRSSIIEHLNFKDIDVLMVNWERVFKKSELEPLYKHIRVQKKRYKC